MHLFTETTLSEHTFPFAFSRIGLLLRAPDIFYLQIRLNVSEPLMSRLRDEIKKLLMQLST